MRQILILAAIACPAMLAACASSNGPRAGSAPAHAPPSLAPTPGPNHDWRALLVLPFGTRLRDVPYRLGEIVMFRDSAGGIGGGEDKECYTLQGAAPPRLFGRPVDEYSLCFSSDRLNRIEASVRLPPESASSQLAAACADWQTAGAGGTPAPDRCDGQEGSTEIYARLTASAAAEEPTISITLIDRAAAHDAGP